MIIMFSFGNGCISKSLSLNCFQFLGFILLEFFMTHKFTVNNISNLSLFIKIAQMNAWLSMILVLVLCIGIARIIVNGLIEKWKGSMIF